MTAVGTVTALAFVAIAMAHTKSYPSSVKVTSAERTGPATGDYEGTVTAKKKCRKRRKVKVFHDSRPRFLIGTDTTDSDGDWDVSGPAPPDGDKVYAEVTPKTLLSNGRHRHKVQGRPLAEADVPDPVERPRAPACLPAPWPDVADCLRGAAFVRSGRAA
jgi:hypothetical protein